jgi:hypothetical protein
MKAAYVQCLGRVSLSSLFSWAAVDKDLVMDQPSIYGFLLHR